MTVPMTVIENIRQLDAEGVSGREIARRVGVSRDSVTKYTGAADFSPQPPPAARQPGAKALADYTSTIESWLADDERRPRKQRHTARRVYNRLVAEHGYTGSYSPVQRFIKAYKTHAAKARGDGYLELAWAPGHAQVDFGQAEAIIAGIRMVVHMLVVTFPYSNMRFVQLYRGETAECICHGLRAIFEHIQAVPRQLVLDNATGAGRRVGKMITESKLFAAFKAHYRTSARYCNPDSGHEKGNVENAVGYTRRNLMVPEPAAASLSELNTVLLAQCDELGGDEHWRKHRPISELFAEDVAACLHLPGIGFEAVRHESRRADKTGAVLVESNSYLAGPAFGSRLLTVAIGHDTIAILDEHAAPVVSFDRVFGHHDETIFATASLLPALAAKPGAWSNSPVRPLVPDPVRDWLDQASNTDRARFFARIEQTTTATDFDTAITAAHRLIMGGDDPGGPSVGMLARRIAQGTEPAPAVVDLGVYDQLLRIKEDSA